MHFCLKIFKLKKSFAGNNSSSVKQIIMFKKEKCESSSDADFTRSAYFAKIIRFPNNNPSVLLATQDDITRISHQYRASHATNVSNNSVKFSEELNLQHFLEWFGKFDRNIKLKSIKLQNNRIYFDCDVLKLLERSILADVAFDFDGSLDAHCMGIRQQIENIY